MYLGQIIKIWGGACITALHKLKVLQNRAVRLITSSPFRFSSSPIFKRLQILKIADIRRLRLRLNIAMFMMGLRILAYQNTACRFVK